MSTPAAELFRLVHSLFGERSLADRVLRRDHRPAILRQIAGSREIRVVPQLFPLLGDEAIAQQAAGAVAELVREATPAQLAWLDERLRDDSTPYLPGPWRTLPPPSVSRLAQSPDLDPVVVGLLASHPSGFVRAAVLEVLAQDTSGQELPFLALRANDWVEPVADRASALLVGRLRPANRRAVVNALPFLVRALGRRRRDPAAIERALAAVVLSDGGEDALAATARFDTAVRRMVFELLTADGAASGRRMLDAGLTDADAVIRSRTLRLVAADPEFSGRAETLERFLRVDRVPAVRRLSLALLAEHLPARLAGAFPQVLLDRAASVRDLARYIGRTRALAPDPRSVYVAALASTALGLLTAAVDGVGETGSPADADRMAPFLSAASPRIRRAALRALARLDAERAVAAALAALADDASSVRATALAVLSANAGRVDFGSVSRQIRALADPEARRRLLRLLLEAPKWEAPSLLFEMLSDADDGVRAAAVRLVERWIAAFNRRHTVPTATQLQRLGTGLDAAAPHLPELTARTLRFIITPRR